jgi:hypothetical protein
MNLDALHTTIQGIVDKLAKQQTGGGVHKLVILAQHG